MKRTLLAAGAALALTAAPVLADQTKAPADPFVATQGGGLGMGAGIGIVAGTAIIIGLAVSSGT